MLQVPQAIQVAAAVSALTRLTSVERCVLTPSSVDVEVLLYVHRNHMFFRDGKPRAATSTLTHLLSSVHRLSRLSLYIHDQ